VHPEWAARAIRAVGNYGEMYERNLGQASGLGFERGYNRLWTQGGLLYAPPLD
jgi:general L-amino acid transport system substrate-binding protein